MSLAPPRTLHVETHLDWGLHAPLLRQSNQEGTKQGDWPKGRQRPGEMPAYKWFKLPQGASLSDFALHLSTCTVLFNKLLTLHFTFCLLSWIRSWLGRQGLWPSLLARGVQCLGLPGKLRPHWQGLLTTASAVWVQNHPHSSAGIILQRRAVLEQEELVCPGQARSTEAGPGTWARILHLSDLRPPGVLAVTIPPSPELVQDLRLPGLQITQSNSSS